MLLIEMQLSCKLDATVYRRVNGSNAIINVTVHLVFLWHFFWVLEVPFYVKWLM